MSISTKNKTTLLFLGVCIPLRAAIAAIACRTQSPSVIRGFAMMSMTLMIAWTLLSTGVVSRDVGAETFGNKIWWKHLRPVHAFLHGMFAVQALTSLGASTASDDKNTASCRWLQLDVIVGVVAHLWHHYLR